LHPLVHKRNGGRERNNKGERERERARARKQERREGDCLIYCPSQGAENGNGSAPNSARSSPSPPPSVAPTDELICFHSKRTHEEDIIGLPIALPTKQLKDITTPLELLSYTSFKEGVRKSVFGEAFDQFLPLYVDAEHGKKSREVLRRAMTGLAGKKPQAPFEPMSAIEVIPKVEATPLSTLSFFLMSSFIHS
jgi:hypothetical protein